MSSQNCLVFWQTFSQRACAISNVLMREQKRVQAKITAAVRKFYLKFQEVHISKALKYITQTNVLRL